jgi:pimeloyl-ACP methyl ester carboxylesterase
MSLHGAVRPGQARLIIGAAVLALASALLAFVPGSSARAAAAHPVRAAAGTKPTIVLEHGAWADSGSWNAVTTLLQAAGYIVDAPPNPLRGLSYDSSYLAGFLSTISGPVVLVGHSYCGMVITNAATGHTGVKALVYDDAYIPAQDDTLLALTKPGSCLAVDPATVFNQVA